MISVSCKHFLCTNGGWKMNEKWGEKINLNKNEGKKLKEESENEDYWRNNQVFTVKTKKSGEGV